MKKRAFAFCFSILIASNIFAQLKSVTPSTQVQKQIDVYIGLVEKYKTEKNNLELAKYYNKIAFQYWEISSTKEAIQFFSKSVQINEELGNQNAIKKILSNMGMIYFDAENFQTARGYFEKSMNINQKLGKKEDLCSDYINIAMSLQGEENIVESNQFLDKALTLALELNSIDLLKNTYSMLAENYEKQGNNKKSLEYYDKYATLQKHLQTQMISDLEDKTKQAEAVSKQKDQQLKSAVDTLKEVLEVKEAQDLQINLLNKEKELSELKLAEQAAREKEQRVKNRLIFGFLSGIVIISFIFLFIVSIQIRQKKKANQLLEKQNKEIENQKQEIEKQHSIVQKQKDNLTDSIQYAKRIQRAVLPLDEHTKRLLGDHFIFYQPRDIVSGDFYWMTQKENILILVAADCTGHGVPGAFMSLLGIAFLNEIVNKIAINKHISSLLANEILNELREQVISSLHQREETTSKEGMDLALCIIDFENKKLQYAGAHNPLYIVRQTELIQYKADKMSVGVHRNDSKPFTNNEIKLQENDLIYLMSDGYVDQFGGEKGDKFFSGRFKNLLVEICNKSLEDQKQIIVDTFNNWKGDRQQLDDVLVIGLKFNSRVKPSRKPVTETWDDKRILIAEDTDINYFLLVEALKPTGVSVLRATNGKEAVEFCKTNDVDLVLMDINMPVMNGNEATMLIKEFRKDIPIIAQTAQDAYGEKEKSMEAGCVDYISKPIDIKSFIKTIEKHLFKS